MSVNQANATSQINNVTKLNQNRVYNHIQSFISNKANSSENTAREYITDIKQFFNFIRGKDIEQLEVEDLKVLMSDIYDYRSFLLREYGYKNTSVNRKINTIRSLYRFLKGNEYDVNPDAIRIDSLPDDSQVIGFLTPDEVFIMADMAIKFETHNRYMKRALIITAFATSMREDALLKLRYSDIRQSETNPNKYIIEPDFLDKGEKISKQIHVDVYKLLLEAKEKDVRKRTDDKIFTMDAKGANQMVKRLCAVMEIDPRRNISFHSFRKAGTDFAHEVSGGDMAVVMGQGGWKNSNTPIKRYLKKQTNITGMAAFEKIDKDIFKQLTHEELLQLVEGMGNGLGAKLRSEAQAIVNGRGK